MARAHARDGQVVGLSWGTSLQAVAAVAVDEPRRVEVVQLVGGLLLLHSDTVRDALLAEPTVGPVVARARAADIALVGIGTLGVGSTDQVLDGLDLTAAERAAFLAQNPVGDTCCRFFDADGRPVVGVVHDRVLAVDLDDLRHIPTVIGVAAGPEKATSVHAALRGGIVDRLITDAALAHAVLTAAGVL